MISFKLEIQTTNCAFDDRSLHLHTCLHRAALWKAKDTEQKKHIETNERSYFLVQNQYESATLISFVNCEFHTM